MTARQGEAMDLSIRLPELGRAWRSGETDDAEFAARYFLLRQIAASGHEYASRKDRRDPRPDREAWLATLARDRGKGPRAQILDWLERYQFRGVTGDAPASLAAWLRREWPLVAREDVPSAFEVLRMQSCGRRPVTIITDWPRASEPVLGKPDAFAFFLHDLEHAWKFFHSPELHAGQREFFTRLNAAVGAGLFAPYLAEAEFDRRFRYLMGDMNTHPEHSSQYLRAILVEFYGRREETAPGGRLSDAAEGAIREVMAALQRTS